MTRRVKPRDPAVCCRGRHASKWVISVADVTAAYGQQPAFLERPGQEALERQHAVPSEPVAGSRGTHRRGPPCPPCVGARGAIGRPRRARKDFTQGNGERGFYGEQRRLPPLQAGQDRDYSV